MLAQAPRLGSAPWNAARCKDVPGQALFVRLSIVCLYVLFIYVVISCLAFCFFCFTWAGAAYMQLAQASHARARSHLHSGGWRCAIVGVPWRVPISACLAWSDAFANNSVSTSAEKAEPSETPWHTYDGTPATA